MEKGIDRRSFLVGGAAAGIMAMAGGALAGCATGKADGADAASGKTGMAQGEAKAEVARNDRTAPIEPVAVPEKWDKEVDVVVVGAGGGGLNAASRACQEGLSCVVLEKLTQPGGNTQSATMFTLPGGTALQNEAQIALPEYPYDAVKWNEFIAKSYHNGYNPDMIKLIGENIVPCFDWMTETYGLEWQLGNGGTYATVAPVGMTVITEAAYRYATENGAEFLLGCEALALVMDGERVVGVKAKAQDGSEIHLHGKKGVLLTGGGFAANKDLLAEYCPSAVRRAVSCYLTSTDSGECFRMGLGAGAMVSARNSFAMFDGGMDWENHGGEWCRYLYDGSTQLVRQPWLSIDCAGRRMRYIPTKVGGALTDQATVETSTPDNRAYVIFDSNWDEYLQTFGQKACREPIQDGVARQSYVPAYYQDYHAGVQDAIDAGLIFVCDTLDELAEKLGLDAGVVKASVDDWNAMVASGHDDFVFPLEDEWLHPVDAPPYYGAKIGGNLFQSKTGLLINTKMQVLNTKGTVIPGLYAGWYTAASGIDDHLSTMAASVGGVSNSYLGGFLAIGTIAEEE